VKQATAKRARFVVRGLVQGVNFRAAVAREANARRLTGRVWNRDDGGVELVAEGAEPDVADLARWLRQGPRLAEVESVERTDVGGDRHYREFAVSYGPAR
jgi:acylphosphatase